MLSPQDIQLMERYYSGQMSAEEQAQWQARLATDTAFAQEVAEYGQLFAGFRALELEHLQQNFQQWEQAYAQQAPQAQPQIQEPTRRLFGTWRALAALAAALVLPLGAWFLFQQIQAEASPVTAESLFQENFSPYTYYNNTRGHSALAEEEEEAEEDSWAGGMSSALAPNPPRSGQGSVGSAVAILDAGVSAYNAKKYSRAVEHFEAYLAATADSKNQHFEIKFYLGVALLAEDRAEEAKAIFEKTSQTRSEHNFVQVSQWYLALSLLKLGENAQARKLLQRMAKEKPRTASHNYQKQAKAMLQKMDEYGIQ